jgi:hypothetical protein
MLLLLKMNPIEILNRISARVNLYQFQKKMQHCGDPPKSPCVDDIIDNFGKKPSANARKTFEPVCPKMCDREKPRSRLNELIERERHQ